LAAALFSVPAHALEWRFEPFLNTSATLSDNANQSDADPEGAFILTATPGFTLHSEGSRRVQASLSYGLSGTARFGDRERTYVNHNLGALGNAELVDDFLYIDGTARLSQQLISLFGSPAEATINDANRATTFNYLISPYIQKRLGSYANLLARYSNSGSVFENDAATNANVNTVSASLTSGTRFKDLFWGLDYSNRDVKNKDDADASFERASATVGYQLTRKFRVFASAGEEWNDYVASGTSTSIDGSFYSVGFGWAPSRRASIEASVGERYFGTTYSFSGNYRTRTSNWTVRYYEDISDVTQQLLKNSGRVYWLCDGGDGNAYLVYTLTYDPPSGTCTGPYDGLSVAAFALANDQNVTVDDLVAAGVIDIALASGVYVIKGFNAGVSWNLRRWDVGLSVHDTTRIYEAVSQAEDRVQGATGAVSYRLSPQTTASGSLSFTRNSADALLSGGEARDDDIVMLGLGLNHQLNRDTNGLLTYRHIQRDSSATNRDYDENRLTATLNMRF
jgi:uncharacterized protein (PEP-CTERM system associated)